MAIEMLVVKTAWILSNSFIPSREEEGEGGDGEDEDEKDEDNEDCD